jgi:ribonuclease HI
MVRLAGGSSSSSRPCLGSFGCWWTAWWQLLLVLRFDGSLHPPLDGTARMVTAACALFRSNTNVIKSGRLLLVGGTYASSMVSNDHGGVIRPTTSAEAEFSGLLLGLEGLLHHKEALLAEAALLPSTDDLIIHIQGDCKTVIQLMQGRARARKLDEWCDRAHQLVDQLVQSPWKLQFEHVPRTENTFCDGLCRQLTTEKRNSDIQRVYRALVDILERPAAGAAVSGSRTALLGELLTSRHLSNGKTNIPVSVRLDLYSNIIAPMALRLDAYELLYAIGQRTEYLAAAAAKIRSTKQPLDSGPRGTISESSRFLLDSLFYQATALRKLGSDKKAAKAERRERSLLLRHAVGVSELMTRRQDLVASPMKGFQLRVLAWAEDGATGSLRGIVTNPQILTNDETETVARMTDLLFPRLDDGSCNTEDTNQDASSWIPLGPFQTSKP